MATPQRPSHDPSGDNRYSSSGGLHLPKMENRLPVGPGSRGGHWHDPEFRRQYNRDWKREHYGYREREAERKRRSRWLSAVRDEQFGVATFSEACVEVVRREASATSGNRVSIEMAVSPRTVGRWLDGSRTISAEGIDAVIATYGLRRVLQTKAELAKETRRRRRTVVSRNSGISPGQI